MADRSDTPATDDNLNLNRIGTVGQLRAALAGISDDTPLVVNTEVLQDPEFIEEQVITSAGFGSVNWGDGYGLEQDKVFGLNCHIASLDELDSLRKRPVRPRLQAEEAGR